MIFHDKRIVITGGVGGIGQALVKLFALKGARVFFTDCSDEDCNEFAEKLDRKGLKTLFLAGNLRDKLDCENIIATAVEEMGGVDILINNAGVSPRGTILETTDDMWFGALDVNLTAVFFLCRAVIPHMQAAGGGAIVNVSSAWGIDPGPAHLAYCTSKGALGALTRNLGRDHAPDGIRVNAVCPSEINTPMSSGEIMRRVPDPKPASRILNRTAQPRQVADPDEVADVIAFLASHEARNICGETIGVNGAKPVYG